MSGSGHCSGFHRSERTNALPQWLKTCRTSTSVTNHGLRPSTAQASSSSGFAGEPAEAVDAERLGDTGNHEEQADAGPFDEVLDAVEAAIAGKFGDQQRVSASTRTKPAGPPFGPASHEPSSPVVAMTRNGEAAMNSLVGSSSARISFATTRGSGSPNNSRNCCCEEISSGRRRHAI